MAELPKLISTVPGATPAALTALKTEAVAAVADSVITQAELKASLQTFLESLSSNSVIDEKDPVAQLAAGNPAIATFVTALQQSLFNSKAATTQGLLLASQLSAGTITQAQFQASVNSIVIPSTQLQAAVSGVLPQQTQILLLALASNPALTGPAKLNGTPAGETEPKTPIGPAKLDGAAAGETVPKAPVGPALLDGPANGETAANDKNVEGPSKLPTNETDAVLATKKAVKQTELGLPGINGLLDGETVGNDKNVEGPDLLQVAAFNLVPPAIPGVIALEIQPLPQPVIKPPLLQTTQTDEKLGNNEPWLSKLIKIAAAIAAQNIAASASSLISLKPQPKVVNGARAVVKLNDKVVVLCTSVKYDIQTDWTEIRGIDELLPNDLAPSSYTVKGTMSILRVPNESPIQKYYHQDMFSGIIWPYTTIEIRDKRTDELLMLVTRAAITSRSESFAKGQLTSTDLSFVGIGFRDEEMPKVLPDTLPGDNSSSSGGILGAITSFFS
jgi:hypothetical protein